MYHHATSLSKSQFVSVICNVINKTSQSKSKMFNLHSYQNLLKVLFVLQSGKFQKALPVFKNTKQKPLSIKLNKTTYAFRPFLTFQRKQLDPNKKYRFISNPITEGCMLLPSVTSYLPLSSAKYLASPSNAMSVSNKSILVIPCWELGFATAYCVQRCNCVKNNKLYTIFVFSVICVQ